MNGSLRGIASGVVLCWAIASAVSAQAVSGVVHDSASGLPIAGAVVSLLDTAGHAVARTLTDARGRFGLTAPSTAVRLQALHIGHLPRELAVSAGGSNLPAPFDVMMSPVPVRLEAMRSTGSATELQGMSLKIPPLAPLCPRPPDGGAGMVLWEQARAEFLAAAVARSATQGRLRLLSYERDIDPKTSRITHQTMTVAEGLSSNPAFAARSAAEFEASGYIVSGTFYGPDVDVLLADAFSDSHCFHIEPTDAEHRGQVGVAFAPMRSRPLVADISGVLWIDSTGRAIQTLEYRYTNVTHSANGALGGLLTFRVLGNGVPIVERWVIRLSPFAFIPEKQRGVIAAPHGAPAAGVAAIETGAELLDARWPDSVRWTAELGTVTGSVLALANKAPVGGAYVSLAGTDYTAVSDSTGAFVLKDVLPGRYTVQAVDGTLAPFQLGDQGHDDAVDVARGAVVKADARMRTQAEVMAHVCGETPPAGRSDLLIHVASTDGKPLHSIVLRIDPDSAQVVGVGDDRFVRMVKANDRDSFAACSVSWAAKLHIVAKSGSASVTRDVRIVSGGVLDTLTMLIAEKPGRWH